MKRHIVPILLLALLAAYSCKKDNPIITDDSAKLTFSSDTVLFDTVFTSLGSATHQLKIYNNYAGDLNISSIRLVGGEDSPFRLNLDGVSGIEFSDKEIPANDSLFSFLNVTIDPNDLNTPFVVEDELEFVTNGNTQTVKLLAWGQNANYIVADRYIKGYPKFKIVADSLETTYWTNERPYVIYGYALINSYGSLHIQEGTHIYIHSGGGIWSYSDGQLVIEGSEANPVIIQGDRLEAQYQDNPGQWDRIWLMDGRSGADHVISHAIIRNAFIGIQAESFNKVTQCSLKLDNTVIEDNTGYGIYSVLYSIEAENFIIAHCREAAMAIVAGGNYRLVHGTIANCNWSYSSARTKASLYMNNFLEDSLGTYEFPFSFVMANSILYGDLNEEITTYFRGADTTYLFDHCLVKSKRYAHASAADGFNNCVFNTNPYFKDYDDFDLHIDSIASDAIGGGNPIYGNEVPYDLDGVSRVGVPDIGAYQYIPRRRR